MSTLSFIESLQAIKSEIDLATYISSVSGSTFVNRRGRLVASCPFPDHRDSTPSFVITPELGRYHCFGCQRQGDLFDFVQDIHSIPTLGEAVSYLIREHQLNITIPTGHATSQDSVSSASLYAALQDMTDYIVAAFIALPDSHPAKQMVLNRNLPLDGYPYGYVDNDGADLLAALRAKGHQDETLYTLGILNQAGGCQWTNRLLFTFTTLMGRPVGHTGRALDDHPAKYRNSPTSPLFQKGDLLFHADVARRHIRTQGSLIVCEGQFDVLAFDAVGFPATVCASGTAIGERQIELMHTIAKDTPILFAFDADEAGWKALTSLLINHATVSVHARVITLPDGQDPCDLRLTCGDDALRQAVDTATPIWEWVAARLLERYHDDPTLMVEQARTLIRHCPRLSLAKTFALSFTRHPNIDPGRIMQAWQAAQPVMASPMVQATTGSDGVTGRDQQIRLAAIILSVYGRALFVQPPAPFLALMDPDIRQSVHDLAAQSPRFIPEYTTCPHVSQTICTTITQLPLYTREDATQVIITLVHYLRTTQDRLAAQARRSYAQALFSLGDSQIDHIQQLYPVML